MKPNAARTPPTTLASRLALPILAACKDDAMRRELLAGAELDEAELRKLEGRMSLERFLDLHRRSVSLTNDPAFPLRAALSLSRASFPLAFHLLATQTTMRDGYLFAHPYRGMMMDGMDLRFEEEQRRLRIAFELHDAPLGPSVLAEYVVGIGLGFARLLMPDAPPPHEITFTHRASKHGADLETLLGAQIGWGREAVSFAFEPRDIDTRILGADPDLGRLLVLQAERWLRVHQTNDRWRERVCRWLRCQETLASSLLADAPRAMRMSERTLRRKLAAEGTSARDILDELRKERAIELLERGDASVEAIAFQLGFAGANPFRRAFQRWTGANPTSYRSEPRTPVTGAQT